METLIVDKNLSKAEKYEVLLPQLQALLNGETDMIANMANVSAALHEVFQFFWTGFYIVRNDVLVVGPFQGPIACSRIAYGHGVCGAAWAQAETIIVPNVDEFPNHIACSSLSKSEIVVPVFNQGKVIAVLDADSEQLNTFDETDAFYLKKIVELLLA